MDNRGARKGERRGGRTKGTPNRVTIERAIVAERQLTAAKAAGRLLAKEVLAEFLTLFRDRAL